MIPWPPHQENTLEIAAKCQSKGGLEVGGRELTGRGSLGLADADYYMNG